MHICTVQEYRIKHGTPILRVYPRSRLQQLALARYMAALQNASWETSGAKKVFNAIFSEPFFFPK
jgi:hypothetical protein